MNNWGNSVFFNLYRFAVWNNSLVNICSEIGGTPRATGLIANKQPLRAGEMSSILKVDTSTALRITFRVENLFYLGLKSGSSKTLGATYVKPWNTMFTLSLRLPWQGESTGVNLVKFVSNCDTSSSEVREGSNGGFNFRLITSDL